MHCPQCSTDVAADARFCSQCGAGLEDGTFVTRHRRVVVTGLGAVSSLGPSAKETWRRVLAGETGIRRVGSLDPATNNCVVRGDVDDASLPNRFLDPKTLRNTSRFARMTIEAAGEALIDAGFLNENLEATADLTDFGTVIGTCVGGMYDDVLPAYESFTAKGPSGVPPHLHVKFPLNLASYVIHQRFGMWGPSSTINTACATGSQAIGDAYLQIKYGFAPAMVAGAVESDSHPMFIAGFSVIKALASDHNDEPDLASRPFDASRAGFVLGEGAGIVLLEDLEHARARGARIYAEILGFGTSNDAFHPIAPRPDGSGAARAVRAALADARVDPDRIGHVQAHAASTPQGDVSESRVIHEVYGTRAATIPVTSIKGAIGHCMGAAGAIESVVAIYSMAEQRIPPTRNLRNQDEEIDLDIVHGEARPVAFDVMAKHSFGLGGQNACLIIGKSPDMDQHVSSEEEAP